MLRQMLSTLADTVRTDRPSSIGSRRNDKDAELAAVEYAGIFGKMLNEKTSIAKKDYQLIIERIVVDSPCHPLESFSISEN